jgi:tRNA-modifying protein YgfZ
VHQTPLFAIHQLDGAELEPVHDWILPRSFQGVEVEVAAARSGAVIVDLTHLGKVTLSGPDARRFANGMFTNNITRLTAGQGNRSAMCDDRGRVQGLLDLYCTGEQSFFGVLDGVSAAWFETRYEKFIVFDDVTMEVMDAKAPWIVSLQGPSAAQILTTLGLPVPANDHDHLGDEVRVMKKDRTGLGGFDIAVPDAALASLYGAARKAGADAIGHAAFDALRVLAGRAAWPEDGSELSMVHELRLNEEVCSFDKGCYIGQEIINRIDVKGQIGKKLMGVVLGEDALPPRGAEVVLGDAVVGSITSAVRVDGRVVGLGVLRKAAWTPGAEVVVRAGEKAVPARVSELPFAA